MPDSISRDENSHGSGWNPEETDADAEAGKLD
jgi:hypothetical protein